MGQSGDGKQSIKLGWPNGWGNPRSPALNDSPNQAFQREFVEGGTLLFNKFAQKRLLQRQIYMRGDYRQNEMWYCYSIMIFQTPQ